MGSSHRTLCSPIKYSERRTLEYQWILGRADPVLLALGRGDIGLATQLGFARPAGGFARGGCHRHRLHRADFSTGLAGTFAAGALRVADPAGDDASPMRRSPARSGIQDRVERASPEPAAHRLSCGDDEAQVVQRELHARAAARQERNA